MRHRWKLASLVAAAGVSCALATLGLSGIAQANPFFAKQTGLGCSGCHHPGQEEAGVKGLNPAGLAFKNCGYKSGCGAPPAPVAKTSETDNGFANFKLPGGPGAVGHDSARPQRFRPRPGAAHGTRPAHQGCRAQGLHLRRHVQPAAEGQRSIQLGPARLDVLTAERPRGARAFRDRAGGGAPRCCAGGTGSARCRARPASGGGPRGSGRRDGWRSRRHAPRCRARS